MHSKRLRQAALALIAILAVVLVVEASGCEGGRAAGTQLRPDFELRSDDKD